MPFFPTSKHKLAVAYLMVVLIITACSKMSEQTSQKVAYWQKQTQMMTLAGPQKQKVFAWVYAIDPNAVYLGYSLTANLETIERKNETGSQQCIVLTITFDENERVKGQDVSVESNCS